MEQQHLTLSQLLARVSAVLDEAFPAPVWVVAEIADLRVVGTGHCYMELVEKGATAVPRATSRAVVWRNNWAVLSARFFDATSSRLAAGMRVLVKVAVSYHELYGFSLTVTDLDPSFTLGEAERQRRETIARLQSDGVFDINRTLDFPPVVQRVAVVSSAQAAGWRDFVQELDRYPWHIEVTLFEAVMQGAATEQTVIYALEAIADRAEEFDAVVVIRGGGSTTDLAAFDGYRLCSHLAQFPLPVITGIGHDKDRSVADMVAALELKTPTAVAVWLGEGLGAVVAAMDDFAAQISRHVAAIFERERLRLERAGRLVSMGAVDMTRRLETRLGRFSADIVRLATERALRENHRLAGFTAFFDERPAMLLSGSAGRLDALEQIVAARRPESILSLGFAIVRSGGRAVFDPAEVAAEMEITVAKGKFKARKI